MRTISAVSAAMKRLKRKRELLICVNSVCFSRCAAYETVAYANHGFNAVAARVQFLTQATNMNVQSSRIAVITVAPHLIKKLLASDNPATLFRQGREQLKLLVSQFHIRAVAGRAHVGKVYCKTAVVVTLARFVIDSPQHRAHARQELSH